MNIWSDLQTSISFGIGSEDKYNADHNYSEIFYDAHKNYIQIDATYPITDRFTLSGQVKRTHLNQSGAWTEESKGNIYNYSLMIDFNF